MKKILIILITICSLFISCEKEEIVVDEPTFIEEPTKGGEFLYENEFEWVYRCEIGKAWCGIYIDSLNITIDGNLKNSYCKIWSVYPQIKDYSEINTKNINIINIKNQCYLTLYENAVFAQIYNKKIYIYKVLELSETQHNNINWYWEETTIRGIYKCFNEIK